MIPLDPALHIYGLAFFAMGMAVWLKTTPLQNLPIGRSFRWLAGFGITNGIYQWLLLYGHSDPHNHFYDHFTAITGAVSYLALAVFAVRIVDPRFTQTRLFGSSERTLQIVRRVFLLIPYILFFSWFALHTGWHWLHDTWLASALQLDSMMIHHSPRFMLGIPSALLAALCFARLSPFGDYGNQVRRYAQVTSILFVHYAGLLVFSGPNDIFPATVLNNANFTAIFGIPVYVLRGLTAAGIGISIVAALSLFDREERNRLDRMVQNATASLDQKVTELRAALADRKLTEERLEEQATLFRTVLDNVPALVLVRDTNLRFTFINRQGEEHFGRPAKEMYGKSLAEFFDAGQTDALEDMLHKALKLPAGEVVTMPNYRPITHPDRSMWLCAAPVILANGERRGVVTVSVNVSDLRNAERRLFESEALLQSILDYVPGIIGLRSPDGRYLVVGAGCEDWYQTTREDLTGKKIDEIWPPEMARKVIERDQETIRKGEPTYFDAVTTFPNGTTRATRTTRFPVRNEDGSLRGIGFLASDVTAERQAEDQLRQAQKMEAVGQLTGGVAHDFNNLLGIIIGNLDFLEEQLRDNKEQHDLVESATNAALHGAALNRQLLAFSRKQALEPKELDLNKQIPGMIEVLRRSLPATIAIEANHATDLWKCVADASQVETALLNLALNARDAMPDGGTLTITTGNRHISGDAIQLAAELTPGDFVYLSVSDSGTGMTADALKHAFEPFFTTKAVGQGSGLGLSMVYGFAKQSGGHVTIDSKLGRGSTVCLYLPRHGKVPQDSRQDPAPADDMPQMRLTETIPTP